MRKFLLAIGMLLSLCVRTLALSPIQDSVHHNSDSTTLFLVEGSVWASVSSNEDLRPLLSYSNEWGHYTQYDQGELSASAHVAYSHTFRNPRLSWSAGLKAQVSLDSKRTMINELYANANLLMFGIKIGREEYTPIESNTSLSFGSYLMSNNAAPVWRGWVGILDYWAPLAEFKSTKLEAIKNLIEIRGGLSFGILDDEGEEGYTDGILFHEKFAYGRIGQFNIKPYCGLYHSVMMGGTMANGLEVPIDFWASFFAKQGSSDVFDKSLFLGETTNRAGAHQGMWDLGLDFDFDNFSGKAYYQRPFADARAKSLFGKEAKDFFIGVQLKFKRLTWLKEATVEFMKTDWQGGDGTPDLVAPDQNGGMSYFFPGTVSEGNFDNIKNNVLLQADVAAWETQSGLSLTYDTFEQFCREMYNHNEDFGGRSQYLINYFYPQGWTRGGLSMGCSLFHTRETVSRYAPEGTMKLDDIFSNVQVRAINFGLSGDILKNRLSYQFRFTQTRNYGSNREQFAGEPMCSWVPLENYFFATPKNESLLKLKLDYLFPKRNALKLNACFTADFGDLYDAVSLRVGLTCNVSQLFRR